MESEFTDRLSISDNSPQEAYECSCSLLDLLSGPESFSMSIHATLDDVGNTKDGISAVVGYVAYKSDWEKFNWRWRMCLEQLKISDIHTAKYLKHFWLSDHDITDEDICIILAPFIETVKETLLAGGAIPVCVVTDHDAYKQLTDHERKYIRPPEENSFEIAVSLSCRALRNRLHISDSIAIQMDESHNAPRLYARYEAMKRENEEFKAHLTALCFCDDRKHPPVQAADMFGNVFLKSFRRFERGNPQPRAIDELTCVNGHSRLLFERYHLENLRKLAQLRIERASRMEIPVVE